MTPGAATPGRGLGEAQATALAEISRLLAQVLDVDVVAERIVELLRQLFRARYAVLFRTDAKSGGLIPVMAAGELAGELTRELILPRGIGAAGVAVSTGRPVTTADVLADGRIVLTRPARALIERAGYRSVLSVPLTIQGDHLGALSVGDSTGRVFDDAEIRLAQAFAAAAAIALRNARLYEEIRERRDFLQSITENSADGIMATDVHGRMTYVSPGAQQIFGYTADELVGRPVAPFYREGLAEARAVMERLRAAGQIRDHETAFLAKDGRHVEVSMSVSLLRDAGGAIVGTVGVLRDVTERKRAEEAVRAREAAEAAREMLDRLHRSAIAMQLSWDRNERLEAFIRDAHGIVGFDRFWVMLASADGAWFECVASGGQDPPPPLPLSPDAGPFWQAFETRRVVAVLSEADVARLHPLHPRHGSLPAFRSNRFVVVPLVVGERAIGVVCADNKTSGRPIAPATLEPFSLLCQQLATALEAARLYAEAQAREREATRLLEVANALAASLQTERVLDVITAETVALLACDAAAIFQYDPARDSLTSVRALNIDPELQRLAVLRPGDGIGGRAFQEGRPVWTRDLRTDSVATFSDPGLRTLSRERAPRGLLAVPIVGRDGPWGVLLAYYHEPHAFTGREVQLVSALAGHAALALANAGLYREVSVAHDFLRSIAENSADTIFTSDVRGRITYVSPGVREMLMLTSDNRSGDIARCEALGVEGYLVKPVKRVALLEAIASALSRREARPAPPEPAEPPAATDSRTLRILLVEDTPDNRVLVQAYLRSTSWKLATADNGARAVETFTTAGPWDLVLMDMEMPVMDGYTATRTIRQWERERGLAPTPVIALTAYARAEEMKKSLAAGCDAHLSKPVRKKALLETIARFTAPDRREVDGFTA